MLYGKKMRMKKGSYKNSIPARLSAKAGMAGMKLVSRAKNMSKKRR